MTRQRDSHQSPKLGTALWWTSPPKVRRLCFTHLNALCTSLLKTLILAHDIPTPAAVTIGIPYNVMYVKILMD